MNKSVVYKNEPITVEYKLYTRYDVINLDFASEPTYNGFWKEEISRPTQIRFSRTNYKGVLYNVMSLGKYALFPTQDGKLEIPSLEMDITIRTQPQSFFDFGSSKNYSIKSNKRYVTVKEIPIQDKPENYTGAVGTFKIQSSVSSNELKTGDSFTYTLIISGKGNFKHFDAPTLPEIKKFRFIDPEITVDLNKNKISGTKTVKYLVIAQEKGVFTIPPIGFSFFDTNTGKYVTRQTKSYTINVAEGKNMFVGGTSAQSFVESEGADIGFIINSEKIKSISFLYNNIFYILIWILLFISVPISLVISKEQSRLAGNADYFRQKQANKILKKYLKQAANYADRKEIGFYAAAQTGLSNFISDKLKIPRGSTTEIIIEKLAKWNLSSNFVEELREFMERCNQARFMPGGFSSDMIKNDFDHLKKIISHLSKMRLTK